MSSILVSEVKESRARSDQQGLADFFLARRVAGLVTLLLLVVRLLVLAVPPVRLGLLFVVFVLVLLRSDSCGGQPVVVVNDRGACQPAEEQRTRDQEHTEVSKAVE
jgi:hypothetical protein